ncbi:MAG: Shedu immune nuclease family protein [Bacteroidota bacterium]
MALKIKQIKKGKHETEIHVSDDTKPDSKRLVYLIDLSRSTIIFYPESSEFFLSEITIEGFKKLPPEFAEKGYIKGNALYYLDKKLANRKIQKVTISKPRETSYSLKEVVINYEDFEKFKMRLSRITYESKIEKSKYADEFFYDTFPKEYIADNESSRSRYLKIINNIDSDIIQHFDKQALTKFEDFYEELISTKYSTANKKVKLVSRTKIKIDKLAVDNVIAEFEKLLKAATSEADWGKFLQKNLFLIDSKYIKSIPQLNVVLAGSRLVDFGLVDYQGHLDIFEIKKPTTNLLAATQDRGNFYWHTDMVKTLTQAEKYLYQAEGKRDTLEKDILREKEISVKVIKPRAFVLIGQTSQLKTSKQQEDFRILRNSLRNVEIVLFDELLDRLKNLKGKVYE